MKAFNWLRSRKLMMAVAVIAGLCGIAGQIVAKTTHNPGTIVTGTEEKTVISYLRQNHQLPENYITKKKAREAGWDARSGNLCDVLPGKAIGGDRFSNADRVLFASDGLIYVSKDHYQNFVRVE